MDLNQVLLVGRLTRDPELRTTGSGIPVCQIGVATGFVYTNQQTGQKTEQTEFHSVVLWRKLAEIANQYLKKGRKVLIQGRLQTRSWDANDGTKKYRTEIIADNMIMLDSASSGAGTASSSSTAATASMASDGASGGEQLPTIQMDEPLEAESSGKNIDDIPF